MHFAERFTKRCSLELDERGARRRAGWLPRNSRLIFVREPNEHGWTTRWFALLSWDEGQFITVPVLSQAFLVDTDGANHTWPTDPTWNNANNSIEAIGAGGSGGSVRAGDSASGGGAGAYSVITNATLSGSITYHVGVKGAAVVVSTNTDVAGNAGTDTWFNDTAFPTTGPNKVGAKAGGAGQAAGAPTTGGAGGLKANNYPANAGNSGGSGGGVPTSATPSAAGGGGSGGPNGAGTTAANAASGSFSAGGAADNGTVPGGSTSGANGGSGTEFDGTHGCGSGGAGARAASGGVTAGNAGNYGGGGGGAAQDASGTSTSGAGGQGLIALTWTPAVGIPFELINIKQAIVRSRYW